MAREDRPAPPVLAPLGVVQPSGLIGRLQGGHLLVVRPVKEGTGISQAEQRRVERHVELGGAVPVHAGAGLAAAPRPPGKAQGGSRGEG